MTEVVIMRVRSLVNVNWLNELKVKCMFFVISL